MLLNKEEQEKIFLERLKEEREYRLFVKKIEEHERYDEILNKIKKGGYPAITVSLTQKQFDEIITELEKRKPKIDEYVEYALIPHCLKKFS